MERRTLPLALKVAAFMVLCATVATPCSWDTTPVLHFETRPDAPIHRYVDGHLGIIRPTYARSHLVVAYRYLSGNPPSAVEREGFSELLEFRLNEIPYDQQPPSPAVQWEKLRTNVRRVEYKWPPEHTRPIADSYESFDNCTYDAFATAATTLAQRVKTHGVSNPAVMRWLDAQEMVFANCPEGEARIPQDDPSLPADLRADRAYQIAAAHFYALHYDEARARFLAIARDESSPWRKIARIVAARVLMRSENLGVPMKVTDPLALADQELRAILADPSMKSLHDAAWDLLALTTRRRDPQQRFHQAARALLAEPSARRARTDLGDYTILLDHEATGSDEMTDWIQTFQSGNVAHAIERWKATKKTQWLVAAIAHAKRDHAAVATLLDASKAIAIDAPSAATIAHHRARLLGGDKARAELDRILARELPASARNQLLSQRRAVAETLADFLRDLPAKQIGSGIDVIDPIVALPEDGAGVLNQWMSLEALSSAATDASLPAEIRDPLARAVETRRMLLTAPTFETANAIVRDTDIKPYVDAIQDERNWWCAGGSGNVVDVPPFAREDLDTASKENEQLRAMGSGATWILRTVIARAKSHPDDERVPEVLSLAIHGTRRACGDADTEKLAKQAFGVLHRNYGQTSWAKDTKYWYKPF